MKDKDIHITTIGCGDAFSDGGRLQTCFHVEAPGGNFLIDCGASSVAGLKRHGFDLNKIDTVLISHFHGDHYGGLPYLLLEAAVFGRDTPLTILSPPGCRERLSTLLALLYPGSEVLKKLDLRFLDFPGGRSASEHPSGNVSKDDVPEKSTHEGDRKELQTDYLRVNAFPVTHAPATDPHGFRIITAGKVIGYSGDTCWDDNLVPLAEKADFFICECNFFHTKSGVHLDYETLTDQLPQLSCKRMLLTHLGEEMLLNLDKVKLLCAEDGMRFSI